MKKPSKKQATKRRAGPVSPRARMRRTRGGKEGAEARVTIRAREQRVLELSEQGWTQQAISKEVGVTQAAVSKILRRADVRALDRINAERTQVKMRRSRHLEYISREGRRGWETSKQGRVRRRQRKVADAAGATVVTQDVVVDEQPDPRFLDQARKSEEALANLHGLISTPGRAGARPSDTTATLSPLTQVSDETLERAYAELTQPRNTKNNPK